MAGPITGMRRTRRDRHRIRVYVRSTYAVGASNRMRSLLLSDDPASYDVEPGTRVGQLLMAMPELGPPDASVTA